MPRDNCKKEGQILKWLEKILEGGVNVYLEDYDRFGGVYTGQNSSYFTWYMGFYCT